MFDCHDDSPTFYYGYDEAVRDKYLVPYRPVHVARTGFQIEGLKPGELPDEVKKQVRAQGIDPDQYSFEGSDLERKVTHTGTNDAIVREFMDHAIKDAAGTLPAKTIIFAISHKHALELYKSFNRLYPDLQRKGLAKVIDSQMERAEKTLDDFKNKDFPRVAISVDMLDTGIDVPSIRNLVFAKPVFSKVKFWQMVGRGTRTWVDPVNGQRKADFLVIDHWDNFDYFQVNKDGRAGTVSEPLPARLFRLRLEKLQILVGRSDASSVAHTIQQLRALVGTLPLENINLSPHAEEIRALADSDALWRDLTEPLISHLAHTIAPMLRFSAAGTYPELQFENQTEQLALAYLKADTYPQIHPTVSDELADLRTLPLFRAAASRKLVRKTPATASTESQTSRIRLTPSTELPPPLSPELLLRLSWSQIIEYVNWFKTHIMTEGDNPPVGILLCSDKDRAEVEFATAGMDQKLFVSRYLVALPSAEKLRAFLEADRDRIESQIARIPPASKPAPKSKKRIMCHQGVIRS